MSSKRNPGHLAVESVRGLAPYIPGKPAAELERELGLSDVAKLASNENPYGPSPRSLAAMRAAMWLARRQQRSTISAIPSCNALQCNA